MCGIAGAIWRAVPPEDRRGIVRAMTEALAHRGPDDSGQWQDGPADLGHRRLSVIDTSSASHQPMVSSDGNHALVFNGEIYNYRELRTELEGLGCAFRTQGDTEVLLEGYARWGDGVFGRCNGMFAVGVYDRARETLVLARDRLGIKPLYYADTPSGLLFASEPAPLARCTLTDTGINPDALGAYFRYLYTPGHQTIYRGIRKLAPGTLLIWHQGVLRERPYWTLDYAIDTAWTLDGAAERLDALLEDSVRLRQRSDVPLGAFLSGGLDSSSVVAMTCRGRTDPLKTFSIGFDDADANELAYARLVADRYRTDHTEAMLTPDLAALLPDLSAVLGEPFADSSVLPMWLVSKLAREQVTVALSGDGGDELFAGYTWTHMNQRVARYRRLPAIVRRGLGMMLPLLPDQPAAHRLRRFHADSFLDPMQSFRRRLTCFTDAQRRALLQPEIAAAVPARDFLDELRAGMVSLRDEDKMLYTDTRMYLPDDILAKVDRMSMAHGLEARVPLLDHRIVEFAATLPFTLKLQGRQSKRVLKHLMRDRLPLETLAQRKHGFSLPLHRWMRKELKTLVQDTLLAPGAYSREYLKGDFVQKLWNGHQGGRENYGHHLWALLMFELWLQWRKRP